MLTVEKEVCVPNSLSVPAKASLLIRASDKKDIPEIVDLAKKEGLPLIILGGGTNILPRDYIKAVIAILEFRGIKRNNEYLQIEAGEEWDNAVKFAVENDLFGIEALSWIPGKAGSAPIQNIGAYGTEISDCLQKVEAYDRAKNDFVELSKENCQFGYRDSIFKKNPDRFIVVSINLKLSRTNPGIPKYKDVTNYFFARNNPNPSIREIREAVIEIRKSKLPDPNKIPNAGSYFTNPILEAEEATKFKLKFPEISLFPFGDKFKVSAGYLIDQTGLKGAKIGLIEISNKNALVLTNPARASFEEIEKAEKFIIEKINKKFGITLKREPVIIG